MTDRYRDYLESPEWAVRRERVLRRDRHTCVKCGRRADEVHHTTYERIYKERDDDLVSLCAGCHGLEHNQLGDPTKQADRQRQFQERTLRSLYR